MYWSYYQLFIVALEIKQMHLGKKSVSKLLKSIANSLFCW